MARINSARRRHIKWKVTQKKASREIKHHRVGEKKLWVLNRGTPTRQEKQAKFRIIISTGRSDLLRGRDRSRL